MNKIMIAGIIIVAIVSFAGLAYAGYVPILSDVLQTSEKSSLDVENGQTKQPVLVVTSSMEPTIKSGATIFYEDVAFETLTVDDIIVFKVSEESTIFVSRIMEITPDGLKTQADNNKIPDQWTITDSFFMGKVVTINNP